MFMTIEDESDVATLVIWPSLFEKQRRLILYPGLVGCGGGFTGKGRDAHHRRTPH